MADSTGIGSFVRRATNAVKYRSVKKYTPELIEHPTPVLDIVSAWRGHETILADIIKRFNLPTNSCLEFGVEYGFSTSAFAHYFKKVTGVDIFIGDEHSGSKMDHYEKTKGDLAPWPNIEIFKADYRDWIKKDTNHYDLIHVDIIHTYDATFDCGLWSAKHSTCTLFHDTESFPEVKRAVFDVAKATGKTYYNFPHYFGLGIVV